MFYLLIDTCSWIRIIEEEMQSCLRVLEKLVEDKLVTLLTTKEIKSEFLFNPTKKIKIYQNSNRYTLSYISDLIQKEDSNNCRILHQVAMDIKQGENIVWAQRAVNCIKKLLSKADQLEACDEVSLRVMQRFQAGRAPFHDKKGSVNDALILEKFAKAAKDRSVNDRYAFISFNSTDFASVPKRGSQPHKDIAEYFDGEWVIFHLDLSPVLKKFFPEQVSREQNSIYKFAKKKTNADIRRQLDRVLQLEMHQRYLRRRKAVEAGRLVLNPDGPKPKRWLLNRLSEREWGREQAEAAAIETAFEGCVPMESRFNAGVIAGQAMTLRWLLGMSETAFARFEDEDFDDAMDLMPLAVEPTRYPVDVTHPNPGLPEGDRKTGYAPIVADPQQSMPRGSGLRSLKAACFDDDFQEV